jgi:glycosyltransferase involved in cell wall biosynthesis
MPAISVILPTKNRHHLLRGAIESVLRQSFRDFEVLLVDNNPKEHRVADVADLKGFLDDRRVRLFEYEEGTSAAMVRNRVMPEAQGKYITYLDDDDSYYGGCPNGASR